MPVSKQVIAARKAAGVTAPTGTCADCGQTKPASQFRKNWVRASCLESRCHECVSHANRMLHFDITPAEYATKLHEQGGVCAICGGAEMSRTKDGRIKALAVDHDHTTGQIRGLLCGNCNKGLGNLGDSSDRLIAAAMYLVRYTQQAAEGAPVGG